MVPTFGHCTHITSFVDNSVSDFRLDFCWTHILTIIVSHKTNVFQWFQNKSFPTVLSLSEMSPTRQEKIILQKTWRPQELKQLGRVNQVSCEAVAMKNQSDLLPRRIIKANPQLVKIKGLVSEGGQEGTLRVKRHWLINTSTWRAYKSYSHHHILKPLSS